jgi:hypothetical protein
MALAAAAVARLVGPTVRLANLWAPLGLGQRLLAVAWLPVIILTGDIAKMAGYPAGGVWRARHRPPDWRPSPELGRL